MMFGRLDVLNIFSAWDIFNSQWVYWDKTPLEVEENLYFDNTKNRRYNAKSLRGLDIVVHV